MKGEVYYDDREIENYVDGNRKTSDASWRLLKAKTVQPNIYGKKNGREPTNLLEKIMIIKRQFKEKLGHVQKIIVCGYVILNLSRNLTFLLSGRQREETSRSISL